MPQRYSIIEPHPNYNPGTSYLQTGRGGAGNKVRAPPNITSGASATGPASARSSSTSTSISSSSRRPHSYLSSGRGGAGNMHTPSISEHAIFSFDEELESQLRRDSRVAPIYHVGRGGAGNVVNSHHSPHLQYPPNRPGTGSAQDTYFDNSTLQNRKPSSSSSRDFDRSSAKSDASTVSNESGADVFTRSLGKGLRKFGNVGKYMTG